MTVGLLPRLHVRLHVVHEVLLSCCDDLAYVLMSLYLIAVHSLSAVIRACSEEKIELCSTLVK